MLTSNEYVFVFKTLLVVFLTYTLSLYKYIDFFYIILLSFSTEGVMKSIYDLRHKTGSQSIYIYSEKSNQLLRYLTLLISLFILSLVIYVIFCNKLLLC